MKNIGITILATNGYLILGIRFVNRFLHFYKGDSKITFYFFSDIDPSPYLPENVNIVFFESHNKSWVDGTNMKFTSIQRINELPQQPDYLFYFDADTNINQYFDENWFLGELVGGQHYADQSWMKERKGFDRNPKSKAYVPEDTTLPQMYYYGAFFGGEYNRMVDFCKTMIEWQIEDKKIPYEPGVNDESYINCYFHYNPPKVVLCPDFKFDVSDKGSIGETRNVSLDITDKLEQALKLRNTLWDIKYNQIISQ